MNPYLLNVLHVGPDLLGSLLERVDPSKLDKPTSPGRFSPREIIAHLADWEPILLGRIKVAVETPGGTVHGQDEGQMAIDHDYAHKDVAEQVAVYKAARKKTHEYLSQLKPEDWGKIAVHNERGEQSVYDMANLLLGHDLYHLEQIGSVLN